MMADEYNEEYENQIINEEYKIWKKNAPFLYDLVISHELEWPSLTVQWLPRKDQAQDADYTIQKLIIGTNTTESEQNYLMIAKLRLPKEDAALIDVSEYNNKGNRILKNSLLKENTGIGLASGENRIEIETKIPHKGSVNRARYMPQKSNIIATKTESGEVIQISQIKQIKQVHIFDYAQHSSKPGPNEEPKPELVLTGHTQEGYGLSWNEKKPGHLLSAGYDNKIILWDIEAANEKYSKLPALQEYNGHLLPVEDVCWHRFHPDIFGSCGDDKLVQIWDTRKSSDSPVIKILAHQGEIYSLDFNYFNEYLLISGSDDKTIQMFDLRKQDNSIKTFESHNDQVLSVQFSPNNMSVFNSTSADRRCMVWDFSKINQPQNVEEQQDGPPELIFIHGGHRSKVLDASFNINENYMLSSVENENILQVWQMAYHIYE